MLYRKQRDIHKIIEASKAHVDMVFSWPGHAVSPPFAIVRFNARQQLIWVLHKLS